MNFRYTIWIMVGIIVFLTIIFAQQIKFFFTTQTAFINITSITGTALGFASLLYGLYESSERKKLEEKRKSQLWATLDRARYVTFDHIILDEISRELTHPHKHRLWLVHQAACDLYISLIEQYLSMVDSFTYDDLKHLVTNGLVYWKWQERQWRILISQRKENLGVEPPPEFFTSTGSNYLSSEVKG